MKWCSSSIIPIGNAESSGVFGAFCEWKKFVRISVVKQSNIIDRGNRKEKHRKYLQLDNKFEGDDDDSRTTDDIV